MSRTLSRVLAGRVKRIVHDNRVQREEAWEILQQLCSLGKRLRLDARPDRRPLSPALCAVVWTLLSCGILLALLLLIFTLRFRNNRIVKMSSPNLNVLSLCGSILTYCSGFLFAIEERSLLPDTSPKTALQARIWTLCIGSSLVLGPILGKTWRIFRVFTQRMPDKRVIIRDLQLMGLVALLVLLDVLVLTIWTLTDPIQCTESISAVVKVVGRDVSFSLSLVDSCSSLHSDVWMVLFFVLKGSLLFYGTYLAGLTSDVSSPPVNQSPTIMAAVCLVTLSMVITVPVSRLLRDWPNLVYSAVSGAIFICTLVIDLMLFVPQLTQWKQFEDELNPNPSQLAKYFSTPSRSLRSMLSEDQIYSLRGENCSMRRLLTEKNAMIDSLQEQVNSVKEKLQRLMVESSSYGPDQDTDPSHIDLNPSQANPNSSHTKPTSSHNSSHVDLNPSPSRSNSSHSSHKPSSMQVTEFPFRICTLNDAPHIHPPPTPPLPPCSSEEVPVSPSRERELPTLSLVCEAEEIQAQLRTATDPSGGSLQGLDTIDTPEMVMPSSNDITSCTTPQSLNPHRLDQAESPIVIGEPTPAASAGRKPGFVSSEQLQEILQDLCMDAVHASLRASPSGKRTLNPAHNLAANCFYPGISPYVMRKRRPPFRSPRTGQSAPLMRRSVASRGGDPNTELQVMTETPRPLADSGTGSPPDDRGEGGPAEDVEAGGVTGDVPLRCGTHGSGWDHCCPPRRNTIPPFSRCHPNSAGVEGSRRAPLCQGDLYDYSDSDSSSSEDSYCFYRRPYCSVCLQRPYESESTTSETSDSELGGLPAFCRNHSHPVVNFNEDLKPTLV
ncbi:hypothetical protein GJAV_G00254080 [Gymnothorax javanicus]|nr:hypothetical protein GJAV_G00254080 [Gymnothorax javanicus]